MNKTQEKELLSIVQMNSDITMKLIDKMATLNLSISNMNACLSILHAQIMRLESMQSPINDSLKSNGESCSKLDSENIKKNA